MISIDTAVVAALWEAKEKREGRTISLRAAVRETKLSAEAITGIRKGVSRAVKFDALARLCEYLGVPDGPVPFIVIVSPVPEPSSSKRRSRA